MKPERILVFELNWMGDILFSFPFIRAIRKKFPDAFITCAVVPRYADLLAHNPWVNFVHAFTDDNSIASLMEKLEFIGMIRKEKYDTCFLLKPSRTKTVIAALAGIPSRIGFAGKKAAPLTREVDMPRGLHRVDQILALAGAVGVSEADNTYEYFYSEEDAERGDALLHDVRGGSRRMVAMNPGGNWQPKRWPVESFVELAKKILARFKEVEIMITGAAGDEKLAGEMVLKIGSERCYTLAGKTGLNELAFLFRKCDLVISADSGPLHLASAAGVTTIGLFGPTSHKVTGPRGKGKNVVIYRDVGCEVPCYVEDCDKEFMCMRSIAVDEVFGAAEAVLSG